MSNKNNKYVYQTIYSHQLYLNSGLADIKMNGSMKSNVAFFFEDALKAQRNTIEMRISVVNAEFPRSWYNINEYNNKFILTTGGIPVNYYFPVGNYNINSFISKWNSEYGNVWSLTYNDTTNILTFNYMSGTFTLSDDNNSLFPVIGLEKGKVYSSTASTSNGVTNYFITASHTFNFLGINRINIKSSTFNLKNVDSNNRGRTRTIASVPVNSNNQGIIFYNNIFQYKAIIKNHNLPNISIEIHDDYKNFINFNNQDWTITLQIDMVNEVEENLDTLEDIYNLYQEN